MKSGRDAVRFFFLLRKSDSQLTFDLDLARAQSEENPVYYVQYAHARVCSVLEKAGMAPVDAAARFATPISHRSPAPTRPHYCAG